jgi:hypothetical protein
MRKIFAVAFLLLLGLSDARAQTATSQVLVTPNAAAYTAGMNIGGILTIPGAIRPGGQGGTISAQVDIVDSTGSDAAIDIFFFNALPSGTYTDHTNFTLATADQSSLVGVIFNTSYSCAQDQPATHGICQSSISANATALTSAKLPPVGSSLWAVPIMRGTPTYGASQTLYFNFKFFPD